MHIKAQRITTSMTNMQGYFHVIRKKTSAYKKKKSNTCLTSLKPNSFTLKRMSKCVPYSRVTTVEPGLQKDRFRVYLQNSSMKLYICVNRQALWK